MKLTLTREEVSLIVEALDWAAAPEGCAELAEKLAKLLAKEKKP